MKVLFDDRCERRYPNSAGIGQVERIVGRNGVTCLIARALAPWRVQEKSEGGGILNARSRRKMAWRPGARAAGANAEPSRARPSVARRAQGAITEGGFGARGTPPPPRVLARVGSEGGRARRAETPWPSGAAAGARGARRARWFGGPDGSEGGGGDQDFGRRRRDRRASDCSTRLYVEFVSVHFRRAFAELRYRSVFFRSTGLVRR